MKITPLLAALASLTSLSGLSAQSPAPAAAEDLTQYATADALWAHIGELQKGPKAKPSSKEEFIAYIAQLNAATVEYLKKYPGGKWQWQAKLLEAQTESVLAQMGQSGFDPGKAETVAKELVAEKNAPAELKHEAAFFLVRVTLKKDPGNFEKALAAFQKDYPGDPRVDALKFSYAQELAESDPTKADALYKELESSANDQVAEGAKAMLRVKEMMGKPVDLKFTAVDGREVDLSKMAGKVVLVDFWATWCGPCMGEVPNVVATYKKYHDQGFEIVGISLDQSKDKVVEVTKEQGMTWPQYFDGKGWDNEISKRYGITSIPAMWLVNKKGELVNTDAREDLEANVKKLLAE